MMRLLLAAEGFKKAVEGTTLLILVVRRSIACQAERSFKTD